MGLPFLAALCLSACWTTHSSAGGFVREVHERNSKLVVETCDINLATDHDILEPLEGRRDSGTISIEGCSTETISVATNDSYLPPEPRRKVRPEEILDPNEPVIDVLPLPALPEASAEESP